MRHCLCNWPLALCFFSTQVQRLTDSEGRGAGYLAAWEFDFGTLVIAMSVRKPGLLIDSHVKSPHHGQMLGQALQIRALCRVQRNATFLGLNVTFHSGDDAQ